MIDMVNNASGDLFLFLENDWELIEDSAGEQIEIASYLLRDIFAEVVRFRHRSKPGAPLWSRQYQGREHDKPQYLLDAAYYRDDLSIFPEISRYDNGWNFTTARYANWTNNPIMFRVKWFKEYIAPLISGDVEISLQPWWEHQNFIVAQANPGLFTHNRIDR